MYQNVLLRIYELVFKHGSEKTVSTILIKLNLVGELYNTYRDIVVNGAVLKMLRIEDFYLTLKRIVKYVIHIESERTHLTLLL